MTLYDALKASKGLPVSDSYAALWGKSAAESGIKTITGVLPLTFTAKGGTAGDWVIEGNTQGVGERTKNLLSVEDITGGINPQVTITRRDEQTGSIEATVPSGHRNTHIYWYPEFEEGQTYILSCYVNEVNEHARLCFRKKSGDQVVVNRWFDTTGVKTMEMTYTSESYPGGVYVSLMLSDSTATAGEINISKLMLRKADTTSGFIPYGYKIPMQAKQRTKNLYDITNVYRLVAGVTVQEENGRLHIFGNSTNKDNHVIGIMVGSLLIQVSLEAGQYVLSGAIANTNSNYRMQLLHINPDGSNGAIIGYDSGNGLKFTLEEPSTVYMRIYVKAAAYQQDVDLLFSPMIRRADTTSDFEPYYNINQTDIYIGNSPLTQGQSITKAQSGQDITLFNGDNIIDTSLYNKPEMLIKFKEYKE